jgi:rare lipoprotein A (peptidoglycan hydrolase)
LSPASAPGKHAGHAHPAGLHAGHKTRPELRRLTQLKAREMEIWRGLLKKKTPAGFHQLGAIRLDIANEQRKLKLLNASQYRRYLIHKAVAPLKLNLRQWARKSRAPDGAPYDQKSWSMINKIMAAVKSTVKPPPMPKGQKLYKGRATHYGGEKIYGNEPFPEFHGKPTAVGDTYCMFGQTAAFMRAPLNSWARVRDPRTGKFIDVRINDTGAFEGFGVLIDLSRGAYRILGMQDGDKVLIRRIPSSEVVPEPLLCTGRGHSPRSTKHLADRHFSAPSSWR